MQATDETIESNNRRMNVRVALLEKSNQYTEDMLCRIEKKVDKVEIKIDKLEAKILGNIKWMFSGLATIMTLGFSVYQYVKH